MMGGGQAQKKPPSPHKENKTHGEKASHKKMLGKRSPHRYKGPLTGVKCSKKAPHIVKKTTCIS